MELKIYKAEQTLSSPFSIYIQFSSVLSKKFFCKLFWNFFVLSFHYHVEISQLKTL